ncbi:MAG: MFS transporter [Chloroflexi bacterium]|nr:MFS transporter [Chloroflexota bacterium]
MASAPTDTAQTVDAAPAEPTTIEKLRGLRWSIASNSANTVFVQYTFFGSIFVLFLNELGLNKGQIGFLLSLLPFTGLISIFIAPAVARFGYKRTYVTAWAGRTAIATFMLLTPWVAATYGLDVTLIFISVTVAAFSLARSIGMTANMPWVQEYVPDTMRGKYTATSNIYTSVIGFVAVTLGGFVLGRVIGLPGFVILISVGVLGGFVSTWLASFIPGGAPIPSRPQQKRQRDLGTALRDSNYMRYLIGVALLTLATVPLGSFLPLFMQEEVGLSSGNIVLLQIGTLAGGLATSFVWGWAADRYGSKPVMLWGLLLRMTLPVLWMLMPRHSPISLAVALGIALFQGLADMGWGIGSARLLYVSVVPNAKRSDYMALYNAWTGIAGGVSQLVGGQLLQASQGVSGQLFFLTLNPYIPLFLLALVLPLFSLLVMRAIRLTESVGMGEFVGIFLRGNPFLAMTSLIRYHLAKDEQSTLLVTERLGQTRSLLAVDELLETLQDPRFNVRFEAIIAISRMPADPRLTAALIDILHGSELALAVVAAWALGRVNDPTAYDALRRGLESDFRSIQAHCVRALGSLGNPEVIPLLSERLSREENRGLQMAYASALGQLGAADAANDLLALLRDTDNPGARLEVALSLGRLVGNEHNFVQLARNVRSDPGTTLAQAVLALKRRLDRTSADAQALHSLLDEEMAVLGHGEVEGGSRSLGQLIRQMPQEHFDDTARAILSECADRLEESGAEHLEYAILALHTLDAGWK